MSSGDKKKDHKLVKIPKDKKKKQTSSMFVSDIDKTRIRQIRDLAEDIVDDTVYVMFCKLFEHRVIKAYLEMDNVLD